MEEERKMVRLNFITTKKANQMIGLFLYPVYCSVYPTANTVNHTLVWELLDG